MVYLTIYFYIFKAWQVQRTVIIIWPGRKAKEMPFILDWAAKQITVLVWRREEEEQAGSEDESSPKVLNQEEVQFWFFLVPVTKKVILCCLVLTEAHNFSQRHMGGVHRGYFLIHFFFNSAIIFFLTLVGICDRISHRFNYVFSEDDSQVSVFGPDLSPDLWLPVR